MVVQPPTPGISQDRIPKFVVKIPPRTVPHAGGTGHVTCRTLDRIIGVAFRHRKLRCYGNLALSPHQDSPAKTNSGVGPANACPSFHTFKPEQSRLALSL